MSDSSNPKKQKPIIRVLALDGGGVRGLIPLRFLQAVEEATGQSTHKIFHTIAGTSTGGLITALLSVPKKPEGAKDAEDAEDAQNADQAQDAENTEGTKDVKNTESAKEALPAKASEALALYRANGPSIFPPYLYILKQGSFTSIIFYSFLGACIMYKLRAWRDALPAAQRTYSHLFKTKGLAKVLAYPLGICIYTVAGCAFFIIRGLFSAVFPEKSVSDICKGHFLSKASLKDAKTNVGIVATDVQKNRTFVFNSMRANIDPECKLHNASICRIARATSAAPTYFKRSTIDIIPPKPPKNPEKWKIKEQDLVDEMTPWDSRNPKTFYDRPKIEFEDGGTKMNNPSRAALKLAHLKLKQDGENPDDYEIRFLSVGTGSLTGKQDDPTGYHRKEENVNESLISKLWKKLWAFNGNEGLLGVMKRRLTGDVFEVLTNAHNDHLEMKQYFEEIGNPEGYRRQQFKICEQQLSGMDNCTQINMDNLVKSAEDMLFAGGDNDQEQNEREWSEEFKDCIEFLGLKIINQPRDIPKTRKFERKNTLRTYLFG